MKQIKFVPKQCKDESSGFKGHIILKVPNFDEKWGLLEAMGLELDADGSVDLAKTKSFSFVRNCVKAAKPFFSEVAITGKSAEYKSYEDLSDDDDTHDMLMEASLAVVTGMKLGNG